MKPLDPFALEALAEDLLAELQKLKILEEQVNSTLLAIQAQPSYSALFYESLALKFHNFYTGCERIFGLISTELNGGVPQSGGWHRLLLQRMSHEREGRPAVITIETGQALNEFLSFRHVVRNIYGFELDVPRLTRLAESYPQASSQFEQDMEEFIAWLRKIASELSL